MRLTLRVSNDSSSRQLTNLPEGGSAYVFSGSIHASTHGGAGGIPGSVGASLTLNNLSREEYDKLLAGEVVLEVTLERPVVAGA